jgi:hypothetical protein
MEVIGELHVKAARDTGLLWGWMALSRFGYFVRRKSLLPCRSSCSWSSHCATESTLSTSNRYMYCLCVRLWYEVRTATYDWNFSVVSVHIDLKVPKINRDLFFNYVGLEQKYRNSVVVPTGLFTCLITLRLKTSLLFKSRRLRLTCIIYKNPVRTAQ